MAIGSPPQTSDGALGVAYRGGAGGGADVMMFPQSGDNPLDRMTNQLIIRQQAAKKGVCVYVFHGGKPDKGLRIRYC